MPPQARQAIFSNEPPEPHFSAELPATTHRREARTKKGKTKGKKAGPIKENNPENKTNMTGTHMTGLVGEKGKDGSRKRERKPF